MPLSATASPVLASPVRVARGGDRALFARAMQETLGLAQTPKELYQAYGAETLSAVLDRFYQTTGFASYQPAGAQVWDTIFSEV